MASNSWKRMCLLAVILATICLSTADDDFVQYDLDGGSSFYERPTIKLLAKRQTSESTPTKKDTGNSSDTPNKGGTSAGGLPAAQTTVTPTLALNGTQQTDYDGSNVTITNTTQDHHRYYNSTTYQDGMQFWIDFERENVSTHDMLSTSHRRAATVALSFDFPFYGHLVKNITIATGGFLYTGDYVHSWLAATQYIAPLMANFDTSISNHSTIKYMDNGTVFAVQWDNVALQDRPTEGNFSFQAILLKSGDIIFAYKDVPINVTSIANEAHPVKVGVSDAYIIDRTIFFVRRKTIYEYHKVDKKTDGVASGAAIYFTALPTCVSFNSCDTCISNTIDFECVWCPMADRCSDGMDRHRQDWLVKGCDKFYVDSNANCSLPPPTPSPSPLPVTESPFPSPASPSKFPSTPLPTTTKPWDDFDPSASRVEKDESDEHRASNVSSVVGILFLVAMLVGVGGWLFYAYRNPHTPSGQCFIRYRPSQWRWRSGEAHYTAAAIHM